MLARFISVFRNSSRALGDTQRNSLSKRAFFASRRTFFSRVFTPDSSNPASTNPIYNNGFFLDKRDQIQLTDEIVDKLYLSSQVEDEHRKLVQEAYGEIGSSRPIVDAAGYGDLAKRDTIGFIAHPADTKSKSEPIEFKTPTSQIGMDDLSSSFMDNLILRNCRRDLERNTLFAQRVISQLDLSKKSTLRYEQHFFIGKTPSLPMEAIVKAYPDLISKSVAEFAAEFPKKIQEEHGSEAALKIRYTYFGSNGQKVKTIEEAATLSVYFSGVISPHAVISVDCYRKGVEDSITFGLEGGRSSWILVGMPDEDPEFYTVSGKQVADNIAHQNVAIDRSQKTAVSDNNLEIDTRREVALELASEGIDPVENAKILEDRLSERLAVSRPISYYYTQYSAKDADGLDLEAEKAGYRLRNETRAVYSTSGIPFTGVVVECPNPEKAVALICLLTGPLSQHSLPSGKYFAHDADVGGEVGCYQTAVQVALVSGVKPDDFIPGFKKTSPYDFSQVMRAAMVEVFAHKAMSSKGKRKSRNIPTDGIYSLETTSQILRETKATLASLDLISRVLEANDPGGDPEGRSAVVEQILRDTLEFRRRAEQLWAILLTNVAFLRHDYDLDQLKRSVEKRSDNLDKDKYALVGEFDLRNGVSLGSEFIGAMSLKDEISVRTLLGMHLKHLKVKQQEFERDAQGKNRWDLPKIREHQKMNAEYTRGLLGKGIMFYEDLLAEIKPK